MRSEPRAVKRNRQGKRVAGAGMHAVSGAAPVGWIDVAGGAATRAVDAERERIGADLHDDLGQILTGLGLQTGALRSWLLRNGGDARALESVGNIEALLAEARESCRRLTRGYVAPRSAESLHLALERLAVNVPPPLVCSTVLEALPAWAPADVPAELFRIAQEALTNALRHSGCTRIDLSLRVSAESVSLVVEDDGHGIARSRPCEGLGLAGMRNRAARLGGSLNMFSGRGGGTRIAATVPLDPPTRDRADDRCVLRLTWREQYESGHPILDAQHRELFALANALIAGMSQRVGSSGAVLRRMDDLLSATALHFATEEQLLAEQGDPGLPDHARSHRALLVRAEDLRAQMSIGEIELGQVVQFLANDLVMRHMVDVDSGYFALFSARPGL